MVGVSAALGSVLIVLAGWFANSRFVGCDLCADAIAHARHGADEPRLGNARFETRDLTHRDEADAYDLVMSFDAIHDQKSPRDLLNRLYRFLAGKG